MTLTVTDNTGLKDDITKNIEVILPNIPPSIPVIYGPNSGRPGIEYEYAFIITEPDGDDYHFLVEWGDGNTSGWMGPFSSGFIVKLSHKWNETGTYVIRAKLKDFCGESPWGLLEVNMPRSKAISSLSFFRFLEQFPIIKEVLLRLIYPVR